MRSNVPPLLLIFLLQRIFPRIFFPEILFLVMPHPFPYIHRARVFGIGIRLYLLIRTIPVFFVVHDFSVFILVCFTLFPLIVCLFAFFLAYNQSGVIRFFIFPKMREFFFLGSFGFLPGIAGRLGLFASAGFFRRLRCGLPLRFYGFFLTRRFVRGGLFRVLLLVHFFAFVVVFFFFAADVLRFGLMIPDQIRSLYTPATSATTANTTNAIPAAILIHFIASEPFS